MGNTSEITNFTDNLKRYSLMAGGVALVATIFGAFTDPGQFYKSYLTAILYWIGLPLGSLGIMSLHHLVGGGWGFSIQRILEAASRTLPIFLLLFIPIFFGMKELYIWADPEIMAADAILKHKEPYLNVTGYWLRVVIFFGLWSIFIFTINNWSKKQDETGDPAISDNLRKLAGPSLLLYFLTVTFASFDWGMSLDPHWFSTIYGFVFAMGQAVTTMAFAAIILNQIVSLEPLAGFVKKQHFHDIGNLLLAFISLWAYVNLSQFLIIWSGNLPEEIPWYIHRMNHGWGQLGLFVVIFHFVAPFALLLLRRNKRSSVILAKIAMLVMVVRFLDMFWLIAPNFFPNGLHVHWLDFTAPIAIGGIWLTLFSDQLQRRALLPIKDPRLQSAREVHHHD